MKNYLKFLVATLLVAFICFQTIVFGIIKFPGGTFHTSFQSVMQDKYRLLKETDEPKIIVVAGSSGAFGLDQRRLEEATGYRVVNMGLHAGFGPLFFSELSKENINKGDIVLLGYEYGWTYSFDYMDQSLVMSAIDDDIEMYSHIPVGMWPSIIGYMFKYAAKKNQFQPADGIYSRESFDPRDGQMIALRDEPMEYDRDTYGTVDVTDEEISPETYNYLMDFKEYVEDRGASIYFIAPPVLEDAVDCDYQEFEKLKDLEEKELGIPYISDPLDYIFPADLMSDSVYHCNSRGEQVRTELLIEDLRRAGVGVA